MLLDMSLTAEEHIERADKMLSFIQDGGPKTDATDYHWIKYGEANYIARARLHVEMATYKKQFKEIS